MPFNKDELKQSGGLLYEMVAALIRQGPGTDDIPQIMAFAQSLPAVVDEFSADLDASIGYILTGAVEKWADSRLGE